MPPDAAVQPPPTPKYTPRSAAADFVKSLPQLGVEPTPPPTDPPAPIEPAPEPPPATPATPAPATVLPKPVVEPKIPRTAKDWDAYKAAEKRRLEEKESELATIRKELDEARKTPPVTAIPDSDPRIAAAKKEAEELSEKLRLVDITQHPKFKSYYENKVSAQVEMAKKIVGPDNAEAIATLLKLPDNEYRQTRMEEIVSTLSPIQQSRVGSVLNSLQEIEMERDSQIEQAKKDYSLYQEKAKLDAESAQKTAMQKAEASFSAVISTVQNPKDKDGLFIFQKQEGNEEWNKSVDDRVSYAKNLLFGQQQPESLMKAALHAAALPGVVKSYQIALDKIKALEEQVSGLTAAQPRMEGRAPLEGGEGAKPAQPKSKNPFMDGRGQAASWIKDINAVSE